MTAQEYTRNGYTYTLMERPFTDVEPESVHSLTYRAAKIIRLYEPILRAEDVAGREDFYPMFLKLRENGIYLVLVSGNWAKIPFGGSEYDNPRLVNTCIHAFHVKQQYFIMDETTKPVPDVPEAITIRIQYLIGNDAGYAYSQIRGVDPHDAVMIRKFSTRPQLYLAQQQVQHYIKDAKDVYGKNYVKRIATYMQHIGFAFLTEGMVLESLQVIYADKRPTVTFFRVENTYQYESILSPAL